MFIKHLGEHHIFSVYQVSTEACVSSAALEAENKDIGTVVKRKSPFS